MVLNKVKHFVNLINLLSGLFLVCVLITDDYNIQVGAYYIFFSSYIVEFFLDKKWETIKFNRTTLYFLIILFFFALAFLYYPFEESHKYFKLLMERRYPLLGFSVIGIFGVNKFYKLRYFIVSILIATISVIIYLLFFKVGISNFFKDQNLFNLARAKYVNTHMIVNFYFNSALLGVWYLLSSYWNRLYFSYKSLLVICIFLLLYALSISEGRSGFIFGLVITISLIFIELWKKKRKYGILFGILIPWVAVVLISSHQRMEYKLIKTEPRYFLWDAGLSIFKEKPILGYGISTAQIQFDAAREIYQTPEYKESWKLSKHLDSHNQYIQTSMEFGVVGLFVLLFIYLTPYFLVIKRRKKLTIFFTLLILSQSFFDMFATGFFSAILCFWLIFLLRTGNNIKEKIHDNKNIVLNKWK